MASGWVGNVTHGAWPHYGYASAQFIDTDGAQRQAHPSLIGTDALGRSGYGQGGPQTSPRHEHSSFSSDLWLIVIKAPSSLADCRIGRKSPREPLIAHDILILLPLMTVPGHSRTQVLQPFPPISDPT